MIHLSVATSAADSRSLRRLCSRVTKAICWSDIRSGFSELEAAHQFVDFSSLVEATSAADSRSLRRSPARTSSARNSRDIRSGFSELEAVRRGKSPQGGTCATSAADSRSLRRPHSHLYPYRRECDIRIMIITIATRHPQHVKSRIKPRLLNDICKREFRSLPDSGLHRF